MSNVFVLGSGFSKSCGLPTLAELFGQMLTTQGADPKDVEVVKVALEFLYPHLKARSGHDGYPPFEEFLSLVTASKDFEDRDGDRNGLHQKGEWDKRERSALRLLRHCLITKMQQVRGRKARDLRRFVELIEPGDTIMTFNWDTLIEQYLHDVETRGSAPSSNPRQLGRPIHILKLHGSLSWMWLNNPPLDQSPLDERRYLQGRFKDYWDEIDSRDEPNETLWSLKKNHLTNLAACLDALDQHFPDLNPRMCIEPPTWYKTPLHTLGQFHSWISAARPLDEAENTIVVIGYSLPSTDLHARALLRAVVGQPLSNGGMIRLIDPNPEVAGRFFTMVTKHLDYHRTHFTAEAVECIISPSGKIGPANTTPRKTSL